MASDFGKLVYCAVEKQVKKQVGDQKFTYKEWRNIMDQVMGHFAQSLVDIVSSVIGAQAHARAQADADVKAKADALAVSSVATELVNIDVPLPAPAPAPIEMQEAPVIPIPAATEPI